MLLSWQSWPSPHRTIHSLFGSSRVMCSSYRLFGWPWGWNPASSSPRFVSQGVPRSKPGNSAGTQRFGSFKKVHCSWFGLFNASIWRQIVWTGAAADAPTASTTRRLQIRWIFDRSFQLPPTKKGIWYDVIWCDVIWYMMSSPLWSPMEPGSHFAVCGESGKKAYVGVKPQVTCQHPTKSRLVLLYICFGNNFCARWKRSCPF